jgi:hypothetical protein
MTDWNKGEPPKEQRRFMLIATGFGHYAGGQEIVIGHWHDDFNEIVAVEVPSERQGLRPPLHVTYWAEVPDAPRGVEIRPLKDEDMFG